MCSESLSKLACVPFGDSHARLTPFDPTWAAGWYIFQSPHLRFFPPSPPPALSPTVSLLCAPRFNLNFAPAKPKAALRFFKVTRGELYRTVIWHIYSRGFVHVIRAVYIRRTYRSPLLFQPRLLSRSFAHCYAVSRDGYYFEDYTLLSLSVFFLLSLYRL